MTMKDKPSHELAPLMVTVTRSPREKVTASCVCVVSDVDTLLGVPLRAVPSLLKVAVHVPVADFVNVEVTLKLS